MPETLKERVVAVAKEAERLGMCRHKSDDFSISDPGTGYVVITPSGVARDALGVGHARVMDLWGEVIERAAEVKPSSEAMMHLYVYKEREDIRAIVHTHVRYSTAFPIMNKSIMPTVYECAYLGKTGTVPVASYGRVGTMDLARKVAEVMKEYDCCLMKSHGVIAADKDMDVAFLGVRHAEEIAEMYYTIPAAGNGAEPRALPVEEPQKRAYPKEIIF